MSLKLELVRESKLHALLEGKDKDSRLEASGVFALDSSTCFVAFDSLKQVARIDLSLEKAETNALVTVLSPTEGFESIANTWYLICQAIEDREEFAETYQGNGTWPSPSG